MVKDINVILALFKLEAYVADLANCTECSTCGTDQGLKPRQCEMMAIYKC